MRQDTGCYVVISDGVQYGLMTYTQAEVLQMELTVQGEEATIEEA